MARVGVGCTPGKNGARWVVPGQGSSQPQPGSEGSPTGEAGGLESSDAGCTHFTPWHLAKFEVRAEMLGEGWAVIASRGS